MKEVSKYDLNSLIGEFSEALDDEIEKIKKDGAGNSFYGYDGKFIRQLGDKCIYRFILDNQLAVPDDSPVKVKHKDDMVEGHIVSSVGFEITLALERHIGEEVFSVEIISSPHFLLELLKTRLSEFSLGEIKGYQDTALRLFGGKRNKAGKNYDFTLAQIDSVPTPNNEQKEAVATAFGSDSSFIWGPPGTGKTITLGRIVEAFFRSGKTVLVVSHTNVAVDTAILSVFKPLRHESEVGDGKVFRYGTAQLDEVRN